jgi:hypothetical protein
MTPKAKTKLTPKLQRFKPSAKLVFIRIERETLEYELHRVSEEAYRKAAISTLRKFRDLDEMSLKEYLKSVKKYREYLIKEYDITPEDLGK